MIWTGREETSWGFQAPEEVVPQLRCVARLGGGADHEVYLVRSQDGSQRVVKLIRPHLRDESHPLVGLQREAKVLRGLEHPSVVGLIGEGLASERPHLILEYRPGATLAEAAGSGPLENLLRSMVEAAEGLAHMKERGFAHLDVKPSNVITGNPACLVDLGIARSLEEAGGIKSAAGTDAFMAPEQCFPAGRRVGSPADVWGWGATLYLAIVGRPPFPRPRDGRTGPGARWPQVGGTLEIPGNTPVAIREVITLCLQENAAARPSIEEAARSLRNGLP